jgi:hypothetical protein
MRTCTALLATSIPSSARVRRRNPFRYAMICMHARGFLCRQTKAFDTKAQYSLPTVDEVNNQSATELQSCCQRCTPVIPMPCNSSNTAPVCTVRSLEARTGVYRGPRNVRGFRRYNARRLLGALHVPEVPTPPPTHTHPNRQLTSMCGVRCVLIF